MWRVRSVKTIIYTPLHVFVFILFVYVSKINGTINKLICLQFQIVDNIFFKEMTSDARVTGSKQGTILLELFLPFAFSAHAVNHKILSSKLKCYGLYGQTLLYGFNPISVIENKYI